MAKRRYRPKRLRTGKAGRERCTKVAAADGGAPLKLCVIEGKYGFAAYLHARSGGGTIPISTGRARTMKSAMSAARQSYRRASRRR